MKHLVVLWNAEQLAQICLCFVQDAGELLATVAELHDTDATALPIQQVFLGCLQHFHRQAGWASSKVEDSPMGVGLGCL